MTERELISKIQSLKQIKPRQEWVLLVKNQILNKSTTENKFLKNQINIGEFISSIFNLVFQKRFSYALAVLLFAFIGTFSFMKYTSQVAEKSPAALVAENRIKSSVEAFKVKSQVLSEAAKSKSQDVSLALQEVKDAAKELTKAIQKNPQLAKNVALDINNNKTSLDISGGTDLKETSDSLYKAIVDSLVNDFEGNRKNLTEDQQNTLDTIEHLRNDGKYSSALENTLLLMSSGIKN